MMKIAKSAFLLAGPLLLAGCASFKVPPPDPALNPANIVLPESFALAPDIAAQDRSMLDSLLPDNDPAFINLRALAEQNAPTLAAALARIDASRAQAAQVGANRKPYIGADASTSASRQNPASSGSNLPAGISIDRYRTSFGGNISASWDPDIFGQLRASERAANIRITAATADAAAVRQGLVASIAANIVDWQTISARERNLREDIETAQELLRLTKARVRAGISPGFDAVQAESLVAQADAQLTPLASDRARIIGALVTLTGQSASEVMTALQKALPQPGFAIMATATPAEMLRARPDIAAAESRLAAADADIAASAAKRFPKLTLSGTLGLLAFALGDIFSADTLIGSLSAGVAAPLLDFGRIDAEIDVNKARAKEAFANYRGAVFTALGDAETAYGQTAAARKEVSALQRQQALEKDAVYLAGIRYRSGLDDFRTVLNAQRQLNAVNAAIDAAKGSHDRTKIALWLALGGS
jgi:NodT family efflux transporter outer membrane factor (OMF) lipoprotein